MQDADDGAQIQGLPEHCCGVPAVARRSRKEQSLVLEVLDRGARRTGAAKGLEEQANAGADLDIGMAAHLLLVIIDEADGQPGLQLAASGLAEQGLA